MPEEETETVSVAAEDVLAVFQQLYPVQFAHAMSVVETNYWREKAQSNGAAKKK